MARRDRNVRVGGWYHVFNRGVARRAIFDTRSDRRFFLSLVARQVRASRLVVHAYCLMSNHYHLLVQLPGTELPLAMREIGRHYTRAFNARRDRDGPLFRARYSSRSIEDEGHRETVLWYVDQNPVAAGLVANPADHPWGSARDFDQGRRRPWLESAWVGQVVRRNLGCQSLAPGTYHRFAARRDGGHAFELIEARPEASALEPGWPGAGSPAGIEAWLSQRALRADGAGNWIPLAAASAVLEVMKTAALGRVPWGRPRSSRRVHDGSVVTAALLRDLAGLSLREIAVRLDLSRSGVHQRLELHRTLIISQPDYRDCVGRLALEAQQLSRVRYRA